MKKILLVIILQLFVFQIISAQSISESLGGIKTNFKLFSVKIDLEVTEQILVSAAERRTYISPMDAGWGYGYQSVHFEFITQKELKEILGEDKDKNKYRLTFIDHENVILFAINLPEYSVKKYLNTDIVNSQVFYSIDFIDIPVLVLDKTKTINIYRFK